MRRISSKEKTKDHTCDGFSRLKTIKNSSIDTTQKSHNAQKKLEGYPLSLRKVSMLKTFQKLKGGTLRGNESFPEKSLSAAKDPKGRPFDISFTLASLEKLGPVQDSNPNTGTHLPVRKPS